MTVPTTGKRRTGPRTLEQAIGAFNASLSVRTRDREPRDWLLTQKNLAVAYKVRGERTDDLLALGKAIAAFRECLKGSSFGREPMNRAMTMGNLGFARRAVIDIKAAADAFHAASHAQLTELREEQLLLARRLVAALEAEPAA